MTRVNCVPPEELCDQHILAEAREIPRIPNGLLSGRLKRPTRGEDLGDDYRLGPGHVRFFCCRLAWLYTRYHRVLQECRARGFVVRNRWPGASAMGYQVCWSPTREDKACNRIRIRERMPKKPRWGQNSDGLRSDHRIGCCLDGVPGVCVPRPGG